ncbi:uncharacterized protein LOC126053898 [Helicoverpa armigera]|uniref:uncharacterized protein LOC126053898 n=1 Tax=Helicoverpa armigera TaxID=29058 RepID=UPI0030827356
MVLKHPFTWCDNVTCIVRIVSVRERECHCRFGGIHGAAGSDIVSLVSCVRSPASANVSWSYTVTKLFLECNKMLSRGKKMVLLTRGLTSPIERNESSVSPSEVNQDGRNSVLPAVNSQSIIDDENSTKEQESGSPTGDYSGTDSGDDFKPSSSSSSSSNSSSSSSSSSSDSSSENEAVDNQEPTSSKKRGRKRSRNPNGWKKNIAKKLRNSGNEYRSIKTGKTVQAKKIGPPCSDKCRLACSSHFTQEKRIQIFNSYWELGSIERHRDFLNSCIRPLEIASRRINTNRRYPRQGNSAFYLLNDGQSVRVCKTFLINTLGISPRTIRTVIDAKKLNDGIIPEDRRGKHDKHCKLDNEVIKAVRDHIESIPKVESHYLRANTTRLFIDGGLTIAELHRNYKEVQAQNNKPAVNYDAYQRIFNHDFNIGFFRPKKDLCDQCVAYENAPAQEKEKLYASYKVHQEEKSLSRIEKDRDMKECQDPQSTNIVCTYDLQAVLPCPLGNSSAFFYKSRLNCYNFTISNAKDRETKCYFWHEGLGHRGSIEIGSCVYSYLLEVANKYPGYNVIFYSDNCCGQQKNRFIFAMYHFAVTKLNINSIEHKFLIRGHTQNEGDTAHSIIEKAIARAKKSGPIYIPDQYISIIRGAKKTGKPFLLKEMNYSDFFDLKALADNINFNMSKNIEGDAIKTGEIMSIKFTKNCANYQYRTTYKTET